ncbi:hypothetical protein [Nitrogeniibacter aestuarii]|uniref:hypothetical protein n=1 Tax=Nitrogeniibacter aestuarii TaxID=2815343 RepID=UPI001D0FEA22
MNILRFRERTRTEGRFIRQASSRDVYGHVVLVVEPSSSQMLSFSWEVSSEEIPREYSSAVLNGITGLLERLELHCVETTVRVIGGSFNATDSSPKCYTVAAGSAFQDAISNSGVVTDAQQFIPPDAAR